MIDIFETGGTFGKIYGTGKGVMNFSFPNVSPIPGILGRMRFSEPYTLRTLMQKDSEEMTGSERRTIAKACVESESGRIVVIHGTDTMLKTAQTIDSVLKRDRKAGRTVILTGAAQPVAMRDTDGDLNLAFALAAVQSRRHGVYVAMNGLIFPWRECEKGDDGVFRHKSLD